MVNGCRQREENRSFVVLLNKTQHNSYNQRSSHSHSHYDATSAQRSNDPPGEPWLNAIVCTTLCHRDYERTALWHSPSPPSIPPSSSPSRLCQQKGRRGAPPEGQACCGGPPGRWPARAAACPRRPASAVGCAGSPGWRVLAPRTSGRAHRGGVTHTAGMGGGEGRSEGREAEKRGRLPDMTFDSRLGGGGFRLSGGLAGQDARALSGARRPIPDHYARWVRLCSCD